MDFHKLLNKQINKHLPADCLDDPRFHNFIESVNKSYHSFERDKELMDHAFEESELEYKELLHNLDSEVQSKELSIKKLYQSLRSLDPTIKGLVSNNLVELTDYFSVQINKRKLIEEQLKQQFEFQKVLMNISTNYINIPLEKVDQHINRSLEELATFVKADRAYVFRYDFNVNTCSNTHEYCVEGIDAQIQNLQNISLDQMKEWVEANKAGKSISISDVSTLPKGNLKDILSSQDIKSLFVIPMMQLDNCLGFVGFDSVKNHYHYSETEKDLLQLFTQALVNVRERVVMERNLTRTLNLLKTLVANLQSAILMEDDKRKILFTNELFCSMFQIPVSPENMVGIDCSNAAEESKHLFKNPEEFSKRIQKILTKRELVTNELLETTEGRFLERDFIPIYNNGKYTGHLWKYTDVTERILTQSLLEQSEERNRLIMNSAINAIVNIDCNGFITFWNKSAESIFGWTKEEVLGKTLPETIMPERHKKGHDDGIKKFMKTGHGPVLNKQIELPAIKKSGEEFPMEISIIPVEQDGKKFFCSFIQDISERKRAESNLRTQEEKYRNMIANMNLGLLEVDNNEVIQYANQSFCNVSGFDLDELLGKNPADVFVYNKQKVDLINNQVELRKQGVSSVYQIPVKNKRGELRWWAISGAPNYDDQGNQIGSIGIHLDITDQKNLEEDLKKEKVKAQEASKAKEAFLANMSHEIRTPLNAIIGFLRELSKQELTELQKNYVENSSFASQHLLSIINDILDISKIEAGEMSLDIKDFSLQNSISNVIRILSSRAKQKKLNLHYNCDDELAPVFLGDSSKIEQILYNLIGNSLKFTQEGGIDVSCRLISDHPKYQSVIISVKDTGIGMSKEFINNIYKKFQQEDANITRKFGGTGLGMTVTKELVKLMKGKIIIDSEKNKGTTVEITLNLNKGTANKENTTNQQGLPISVEGVKVLLVEDNELNRLVAQNSLRYFKCVVTECENGLEALKILEQERFDIILMDIQMPELDGIETTKKIRKSYNLSTPIIALTANAFKSEIEKCKKAGMDDYLTKPFAEDALLKIIAKYTTKKKGFAIQMETPENIKPQKPLYNLNSIRQLSRGDDEFVKKMIQLFISQTEDILPQINAALQNENYIEVSKLAHKMKPSIAGVGISSISEEVVYLEKEAKNSEPNSALLVSKFSTIEKTLREAIKLLKEKELH